MPQRAALRIPFCICMTSTSSPPPAAACDPDGSADSRLVWEYFNRAAHGVFVDVGANHPTIDNQTWFLEQQGWTGLVVEPNPELCKLLRAQRPRSRVIEAAACAPGEAGEADLHLGLAGPGHSAVKPEVGVVFSGQTVRVAMRTLDSALTEAGFDRVDLLSVDVEGMELDVLRGLDLVRFQPRLILLEEFFVNLQKHRYLRNHGYKLVRRTGYNNWYVPQEAPDSLWSLAGPRGTLRVWRKMLGTPFNNLRWRWRKMRERSRTH